MPCGMTWTGTLVGTPIGDVGVLLGCQVSWL
uniref:Uncharacterized protein n=1 Tax=Daucus carota subsp. sativus TaxID=79200 RepID=A0A175YMV6_DAUCS